MQKKTGKMFQLVKASFTVTYVCMFVIAALCFIEAITTDNDFARHILNIETAILLIAAYFYNLFINSLKGPIDWKMITKLRFMDWSLTLPLMLLNLCLMIKQHVHLYQFLPLVLLVWLMIYFGYLGETKRIKLLYASLSGFFILLIIFWIIYSIKEKAKNDLLFYFYFFIWSLYGIVYLIPDVQEKMVCFNVLDLIAKPGVALIIFCEFTRIIV
jgi:bacteriorhodopsin